MYSFPDMEPVCFSMSSSSCCFLTYVQIFQGRSDGLYSHLLNNFLQFVVIHTVQGCGVVDKAEVDVFLELSCSLMIQWMLAFSKPSLNIWKFTVHVLLKPGLENFEHYLVSVWDVCNCAVVWTFFGIACLWDCNKNWLFPVLWPLLSFPTLLAYRVQYTLSISF